MAKKFDLARLKNAMLQDTDLVVDILDEYGFKNPRPIGEGKIQCGFDERSSGAAIVVYPDHRDGLSFKRYSTDETGDIIDLIVLKTKQPFKVIVSKLFKIFEEGYVSSSVNGISNKKTLSEKLTFTEEEMKNEYEILNIKNEPQIFGLFLKDNILPSTQLKFGLWYNHFYDRICIDWKDIAGHHIGTNGRLNVEGKCEGTPKYYPVLHNFKKGLHLFGLHENIRDIMESKEVIIFESEKSVLQCDSFGFNKSVAIGSAALTVNQLKLLDFIGVEKVTLAFDEGLDKINHMLKKIKKTCEMNDMFFDIKVIYDNDNQVLQRGCKSSPSDFGKDTFNNLYQNHSLCIEDVIQKTKGED